MTKYGLDILLPQFGTSLLFHVGSWPENRFLRRQIRWSGIPISWRISQFVVSYTVKGFGVINKTDDFCNSLAFSMIQQMLAIGSLVSLPFLNPVWTSGCSWLICCWSLGWRILGITMLPCEMSTIVQYLEHYFALPFFELPWWLRGCICLQCGRPRFNPWVRKIP